MIKVGDLVRVKWTEGSGWKWETGIVTKVRRSTGGAWAILLTSGELIATYNRERMEVLNASR